MPAAAQLDVAVRVPIDGSAEEVVERLAAAEGLVVRLRSSPRAQPGAAHWHFARPGQPGTLEATLRPAGGRLWLKVHPRRAAPWVRPAAERLRAALERELGGWGPASP